MEKRIIVKRCLLYILGVQILAAGMMLMVRCNLGVLVGTFENAKNRRKKTGTLFDFLSWCAVSM